MSGIKFFVKYDIVNDDFEVFIFDDSNGQRGIAKPIQFISRTSEEMMSLKQPEPCFRMSGDGLREQLKSMGKQIGYTEPQVESGVITATKYHLEDMRKICDKLFDGLMTPPAIRENLRFREELRNLERNDEKPDSY